MINFVSKLLDNNLVEARNILNVKIKNLIETKLNQLKVRLCSELLEGNIQRMGRLKLVRLRIRKGKVQRRKKLSAVKGFTTRGGKLTRMSPTERRHRKMSARKSRFKRRGKLKQSLRKRNLSLRRRTSLGL